MTPWDNTAVNEPITENQPQELTEAKLRRAVEKIEQIDRDIAHKTEQRRVLAKEVHELTGYLKRWCDETRSIAGPMEKQKSTNESPPWTLAE